MRMFIILVLLAISATAGAQEESAWVEKSDPFVLPAGCPAKLGAAVGAAFPGILLPVLQEYGCSVFYKEGQLDYVRCKPNYKPSGTLAEMRALYKARKIRPKIINNGDGTYSLADKPKEPAKTLGLLEIPKHRDFAQDCLNLDSIGILSQFKCWRDGSDNVCEVFDLHAGSDLEAEAAGGSDRWVRYASPDESGIPDPIQ